MVNTKPQTSKYVSYLRVSTLRQGQSGLGLEAQRETVRHFLAGRGQLLIDEFVEIESGKNNERPKLAAALATCRAHGASLVISRLDRLSRDAEFLLKLESAGVEIEACDLPGANRMMFGVMALVAENERRLISKRTKEALQAAKARGKVLGGYRGFTPGAAEWAKATAALRAKAQARADDLLPMVRTFQAQGGTSLADLARRLNALDIRAPRGGIWHPGTVRRLLALG